LEKEKESSKEEKGFTLEPHSEKFVRDRSVSRSDRAKTPVSPGEFRDRQIGGTCRASSSAGTEGHEGMVEKHWQAALPDKKKAYEKKASAEEKGEYFVQRKAILTLSGV